EFFPEGRIQYYCVLPDEAIDFEGLRALIEKYRIIEWYGYEKTAADYQNREWFQLSVSFENITVNAMGTEPPPHYWEFRREFLELQKRMIDRAVSEFGMEEYR
ncbi:MAG: hypothetical protein MJ137_08110, partial [Clostridia bacterium]|nr:hypothetical protein [Clostridia bacterium]